MARTRTVLTLAVAAAALALVGCGGDDEEAAPEETGTVTTPVAADATLVGTVGPGFEIRLETSDGQGVETLSVGSYTIEVDDRASAHNFHLSGPGVEESTGVGEEGQSTWKVDLAQGSYSFVCDPHAATMSGEFEVTG